MNALNARRSIVALAIALFCSLGYNAYLGYVLIDRSITRAYTDRSFERDLALQRVTSILEVEWHGWTREQTIATLEKIAQGLPAADRPSPFLDEDLKLVIFDTVHFVFENEKLARIAVPLNKLDRGAPVD